MPKDKYYNNVLQKAKPKIPLELIEHYNFLLLSVSLYLLMSTFSNRKKKLGLYMYNMICLVLVEDMGIWH